MSENTSLTDAVKLAAGISLTEAVKGVAGCRTWIVDEALDSNDDDAQIGHQALRLLTGGARLVGFVILTFAFLLVEPTLLNKDWPGALAAHKRVALVVGNSKYQHTPKLENPKNDAVDMATVLRRFGFEVIEGLDLDKAAFDRKIRDFAASLRDADVGVFFYAGHGLQVSGRNYLVPVDAQLTSVAALDSEMVALDLVHQTMEREARTSILFFDACRDNPLSRNLARSIGTRSVEIRDGLAPVEGGVGTLISFSTQPGSVALDGLGRNSPFSGALLRQLETSNDDVSAILIAVRNDVIKETARRQVPWEHSALTRRFYFNPTAKAPEPAAGTQRGPSEVAEAWSAAKDTTNIAVLEAFVVRYADTFYAELARARIKDLRKSGSLPSSVAGAAQASS